MPRVYCGSAASFQSVSIAGHDFQQLNAVGLRGCKLANCDFRLSMHEHQTQHVTTHQALELLDAVCFHVTTSGHGERQNLSCQQPRREH